MPPIGRLERLVLVPLLMLATLPGCLFSPEEEPPAPPPPPTLDSPEATLGQLVDAYRNREYEAYEAMAVERMAQIAQEIWARWPAVKGIAIVQRLGRLDVGDLTTLVACAAGHRDQGVFAATRYGIDRPYYLQDLLFNIVRSGRADGNYVQVTSLSPMAEPFLTFLVEAQWSRGRLLREYTVFLDPPTFTPQSRDTAPAVQAPTRTAPADSCYNSAGTVNDLGFNLVSDGTCGFPWRGDLRLSFLDDFGGDTLTHALLVGSPAIDAIPPESCDLDIDQRGYARPAGTNCDIGAFEADQEYRLFVLDLPIVINH